MTKHLHLKIEVTGKVQGVWFRKSAQDKADVLQVCGFVENCLNGSVYIEVEGDINALENFIQWCHEGPELARVKDVVILKYEDLKNYTDFHIRD
jgi:acylphosphatase